MNDLISVIIPVYNVEKYLNRCIESVANQTYKNLEIILVDDGSSDSCPQICDKWAKKDSRIKVIHKKNGGVSSARNAGLDISNGHYLSFVDSDDWLETNAFEKLIKLAEPQSMVVFNVFFETCKNSYKKFHFDTVVIQDSNSIICDTIMGNYGWTSCWNKLYDLYLIKNKHLYFDENLRIGEDYLFIYQYASVVKKVLLTNEAFYHYYTERSDSAMNSFSLEYYNRWKVTERILQDDHNKICERIILDRLVNELYDIAVETISENDIYNNYHFIMSVYKKYFKLYYNEFSPSVGKKKWLLFISPFVFKLYIKGKK